MKKILVGLVLAGLLVSGCAWDVVVIPPSPNSYGYYHYWYPDYPYYPYPYYPYGYRGWRR